MNALWQQWSLRPLWQQHLGLMFLALAIMLLAICGLWRPLWLAQSQAKSTEPKLRADYQRLLAQSQQHPLLVKRLTLAEAALKAEQRRLPEHADTDLSLALHQLVAAQALNLNQANARPSDDADGLITYPYAINSSGDSNATLALIQQFGSHPELLIMTDFSLSRWPNATAAGLSLEAQLHTLRLMPNHSVRTPAYDSP